MEHKKDEFKILVAIDFSPCSLAALRKARSLFSDKPLKTLVLHVIDQDFIERCVRNELGGEEEIKKELFMRAREKVKDMLRQEGLHERDVKEIISSGIPYIEINRRAVANNVDIIIMGCMGNSGDMDNIFFGSTTEKVLRFLKRPVLCVPEEEEI